MLPPSETVHFCAGHDKSVLDCLADLLGADLTEIHFRRVHLALSMGGMGLRSAVSIAPASYWASWADCLQMIHKRHPHLAQHVVACLENPPQNIPKSLFELLHAEVSLREDGFESGRSWRDLLSASSYPRDTEADVDGENWIKGWQKKQWLPGDQQSTLP